LGCQVLLLLLLMLLTTLLLAAEHAAAELPSRLALVQHVTVLRLHTMVGYPLQWL
jgi:hypothetical protein